MSKHPVGLKIKSRRLRVRYRIAQLIESREERLERGNGQNVLEASILGLVKRFRRDPLQVFRQSRDIVSGTELVAVVERKECVEDSDLIF